MKANLHIHTTNSDGTKTVSEINQLAQQFGFDLVAITDHDTVEAIDEINAYTVIRDGYRFAGWAFYVETTQEGPSTNKNLMAIEYKGTVPFEISTVINQEVAGQTFYSIDKLPVAAKICPLTPHS